MGKQRAADLTKLVRFGLFMTQDCWGSPTNYLSSRWLADAILKGIDLGCLSFETIHFGIDQLIWDHLIHCEDPFIQKRMQMVSQTNAYYCLVDPSDADLIIKNRFSVIDPWIVSEGKIVRLTTIDPTLAEQYQNAKEKIETGWAIKFQGF